MPDVFAESDIPSRFIMVWSDSLSNIPAGWALADGNNGTPDLLDKFIVSTAGKSKAAGATAGSHFRTLESKHLPDHTHTGQTAAGEGSHSHLAYWKELKDGVTDGGSEANQNETGGGGETDPAGSHSHTIQNIGDTGSGASLDIRPEYYEVAYIVPI